MNPAKFISRKVNLFFFYNWLYISTFLRSLALILVNSWKTEYFHAPYRPALIFHTYSLTDVCEEKGGAGTTAAHLFQK